MTKKQVVPVLVKPILRGPVCVGYTTIKMVVEPLTFVLFKVIGVLPQSLRPSLEFGLARLERWFGRSLKASACRATASFKYHFISCGA